MKLHKLTVFGIALQTVITMPMLIMTYFFPNSNPVGLGLLFTFGSPITLLLTLIGLILSLKNTLKAKKQNSRLN